MRRAMFVLAVTPLAAFLGAVVAVQGVITWRTDYEANAATDRWMNDDFRQWAEELKRR